MAGQHGTEAKRRRWAPWLERVALTLLGAAIAAFVSIAIDQCWFGLGHCDQTPDVRIDTVASRFNAPGYDNPAKEYVCLVNSEDKPVDLAGWQLREGNGDLVNTLPSSALAPGAAVRVHPGRGRDSVHDLYGDHAGPVWTNSGDSVTLVDSNEQVIAKASYGSIEDGESPVSCK